MEDFSYTSPPTHPPLSEASSSSSFPINSRPPPFSSLFIASDSELSGAKADVSEAPGASSLPAFAPPHQPSSSSFPLCPALPPSEEDLDGLCSTPADSKAPLEGVEKKGASSGKNVDDGEPPPPYTEGYSPLESFTYVMAAAGGAASIITQVQQSGGPPINTLGGMSKINFFLSTACRN